MAVGTISVFVVALLIRALIINNYEKFQWILENVFVSTPTNSWKRVEEGMYLRSKGVSPYSGDILHEPPLILLFFESLLKFCPSLLPILFLVCEFITAISLSAVAKSYLQQQMKTEEIEKNVSSDLDALRIKIFDVTNVPLLIVAVYLFNPYSIVCCGAKCTAVISNVIIALALYSVMKGYGTMASLLLSFATYHTLYPVTLVIPSATYIAQKSGRKWKRSLFVFSFVYLSSLSLFTWISFHAMGNWKFVEATYGCIFNVNDLTPNIGLFWYFFTEMFDHFRTFFIFTFQLNALVYTVPLVICFRKNPVLVIFTLLGLMAIFKSYTNLGDVALYTALLPLWIHLYPFTRHLFLIGCFFLTCSAITPVLYTLWIYYGSANANFFFGATLAFNAAQVFLVTDILFGYIKREFHMKHGLKPMIGGEEAKLCLQ